MIILSGFYYMSINNGYRFIIFINIIINIYIILISIPLINNNY